METETGLSDELRDKIEADHCQVEAVLAWMAYTGEAVTEWDRPTRLSFDDAYAGEWDSEKDFAQQLAEDIGALPDTNHWPAYCIDWEYAARELFLGDYWSAQIETGGVYVFRTADEVF